MNTEDDMGLNIAIVDGSSADCCHKPTQAISTFLHFVLYNTITKQVTTTENKLIVFFTSISMKISKSGDDKMEKKGNSSLVHDYHNA